ncbi:B-box-type zinc finger [Sesbania bispinosa]|nr:B-box-type zinc finger [Sesbania bispinosa]
MKIQCDVCNKHEASLFCTADEAALCDGCDHRVHHANKLASKHQRFSLNHPSPKHFPLCDVCRERRAFVFCEQDRAILCKECDLPIHSANELTKKHNRFLLTGIKLSAAATLYSSSPPSNFNSKSCADDDDNNNSLPPLIAKTCSPPSISTAVTSVPPNEKEGFTSSSISEYLINTIPGWQFEDFLDSPSLPFALSKNNGDGMLVNGGDIERNMVSFSAESIGGTGIWVPQAPSSTQMIGYRETKEATNNRSRLRDDNFIVPQMSPPNTTTASKRSRLLWGHENGLMDAKIPHAYYGNHVPW